MPNEEWGVKRPCPKCAVRFYDLQKDPMTCPACDFEFDLASLTDAGKAAAAKAKAKAAAEEAEVVVDDVEDVLDGEDDALLDDDDEDTATLEEVADVPANDDEN